jgi:hypothetical protein
MAVRRLAAPLVAFLGSLPLAAQSPCGPPSEPSWPGVDLNLVGRWRPALGVQHGLSKLVETWEDQSALGHDLTQPQAESRPRLETRSTGGHPALYFDGNDLLAHPSVPLADYSKLVVFTFEPDTDPVFPPDDVTLVSGRSEHDLYLKYDAAQDAWFPAVTHGQGLAAVTLQLTRAVQPGVPTLIVTTYQPGTDGLFLYVRDRDGAQIVQGALPGPGADPELFVGASIVHVNNRDLVVESLRGALSEVLVYDRKLSVVEFNGLHAHLVGKYLSGLTQPEVRFDSVPKDGQLFARDLGTSLADVTVAGSVVSAGFDAIRLEVFPGDWLAAPEFSQTQPLSYSGSPAEAPFAFTCPLLAELLNHHFRVTLLAGACSLPVLERENVTAGDVYVVQGQSNGFAADFHLEGIFNSGSNADFIRSFGTNAAGLDSSITYEIKRDLHWDRATVAGSIVLSPEDEFYDHASVGSWPLRLAELLIEEHGIPIAILNGSAAGVRILWELRNHDDPARVDGPLSGGRFYGRLLYRAREALAPGSTETLPVRAVLFYQGESDRLTSMTSFIDSSHQIRDDWLLDFPTIEAVYQFQVRTTLYCGVFRVVNSQVCEAQRRIPDLPGMHMFLPVATAGIPDPDGCHYRFEAGYRTLAEQVYRIVSRDLYGSTLHGDQLDPPTIQTAEWVDPLLRDEIRLTFGDRSGGMPDLVWKHWQALNNLCEPPTDSLFRVDDPAVAIFPKRTRVQGNTVVLKLVGELPSSATTISYVGDNRKLPAPCMQDDPIPWITNAKGVGALTFFDVPIE